MDYTISTDKTKLDIPLIHDFLSNRSYWAKGRSLEEVKTSIDNTICFGLYDRQGCTIGFTRVLTDGVAFAYLMDVFILEPYRGQGLGQYLLEYVLYHSGIQPNMWMLGTADAHSLYEKFGFQSLESGNRYMTRRETMPPAHFYAEDQRS
ncbi:MAG: GNAT family N-acetyltransferase [Cyanobacteria bacterium P01_E01_bin.6]